MASGATCVQKLDGSRDSAIHTKYRISLRSSSMREPRYPLPRVVLFRERAAIPNTRERRGDVALMFMFLGAVRAGVRCSTVYECIAQKRLRTHTRQGVATGAQEGLPVASPVRVFETSSRVVLLGRFRQ